MHSPLSAPGGGRITGTGHYVPERVLTNRELERIVETSDTWIVERTGIRERRIVAQGEAASDLAANAAREALASARLAATDIDLILVATFTPDAPLPSTAVFVQTKIGARSNCPAMDIVAACAGFCYGLQVADAYIRSGLAKHILLVGVDVLSSVTDYQDRGTCVLFGDGAGAVVVSAASEGPAILATSIHADGSHAAILNIPSGGSAEPASAETVAKRKHVIAMNGREVFRVAVKNLVSVCNEVLELARVVAAEVDWVVPHQANRRILEAVSDRLGVPMSRFYVNLDRYGNTSAASIPIALDEAVRRGEITAGQTLLLCAFGGGVTWGATLLRW